MERTPKTFQAIHVYFTKVKNPLNGFCTHIFFAQEIILIFGGLFWHIIYRLIKVKLKFPMVRTTDFSKQKCRTSRKNKNSSEPSWKKRKKTSEGHTKNRTFVLCTISKDGICQILSSRLESLEKIGFDSYGSSVI